MDGTCAVDVWLDRGATLEQIDRPSQIYDAARTILNDCVVGNQRRVGGEIMSLGEHFASHYFMSYATVDVRDLVGRSLACLASSRITVLKYDVIGNSGRISVKITQRTSSGVHCGPSQIMALSCHDVIDAMPVNYKKIQKYGPPSDPAVTVPLPWYMEKYDSCKLRSRRACS